MKIPHNRLSLGKKEERAVAAVVRSGHIAGGPKLAAMEKAFAARFGMSANGVAGVASGSAALRLALMALGVSDGHEVLVPAYSCVALPNAVLSLGAKPVPVDISAGSWNIDPDAAKGKVTARTKAAIAVNTFGFPAEIDLLKRATGLAIVEDGSHGFSYDYRRKRFQTIAAAAAVISFYATKLLGGGEGGAVISRNPETVSWVRAWRDYTDEAADARRTNDKMSDLEAAVVLSLTGRLDELLRKRRDRAADYRKLLGERLSIELPGETASRVWYRYVVALESPAHVARQMARRGISVCRPVESWLDDEQLADYPITRRAYSRLLSLPLYPGLTAKELQRVSSVLGRIVP